MKHTPRLTVLLVLLGLVLAACGGANVAATVNGVEIHDDQVLGLTQRADDESVADGEEFRSLLSNVIMNEAMLDAAQADFGVQDLGSAASIEVFKSSASAEDLGILDSIASNRELSEDAETLVAQQLLVRSTVKEALVGDAAFLEGVWEDDQDLLVQVCAKHILVGTEEESQAVRERLEAGEDFATVANEVSLDAQFLDGVLPCPTSPALFVEPFSTVVATAPVGEIVGPVETQFGWHVIVVESRESPGSIDELAADPARWIPAEIVDAAWIDWLNEVVAGVDVEVRSQIGTWSSPAVGILSPPPSPTP